MKQIVFIRHAKSSWKYKVNDHDRPIRKKGKKRAIKLAKVLKNSFSVEGFIGFTSTAKRATETAKVFSNILGINFIKKESSYTFSEIELENIIAKIFQTNDNVVIVGHNPAFTNLINKFGTQNIHNLPTSSIAIIQFEDKNWEVHKKGITLQIITES